MKKTIIFVTLVLTALCVANIAWWIYITTLFESFEDSKQAYLNSFPDFLRNARIITFLSVLLSGINIGFSMYFLDKRKQMYLFIPLLIINALILTWNLWSML